MVEVLIAGILLASALAAVSRISVAALSGSANLSDRARIEAAINDNIQAMQKEDSYYTDEWIIDNGDKEALKSACTNPPEALSSHLQTVAPEPRMAAIKRTFDISSIPGILRIVYSFEGPEQQVKAEQRIIEMTPNFAAKCYSTR
ncbi:hypothetical protein [Synechococcus sp. MU1617]|uniref:hypothetical protein n=1 Tax=Synechococcus sp. MU1617 TaxID=2508346 RepID=UPI001CF85FAA|nr:hypothetical protein [Synechococcus sp. MU1617]MCB4390210.1 hypothetical protein [Synechococcus sp. MU1617]